MSIFITGATGFIGSHLAIECANKGEMVRVICRPTADVSALNHENIQILRGDINDVPSIEEAMHGCKYVYHLAAYARNWARDASIFFERNVQGLKNVLDVALRTSVDKVVFTSTSVTLGPSNSVLTNESTIRQVDCFTEYEQSKFLAEKEALEYVQKGLNLVVVNPTRVFGPGLLNEGNSVTKMIQLYQAGKWRLILDDGRSVGNYVFIDDVVRGHLLAMKYGNRGERYILGGENVSYNDFFRILSEVSKSHYRMIHIPQWMALAVSNIEKFRAQLTDHYPLLTPGWVKTFLADWEFSTEKAQSHLGYTITPFHEALEKTVQWLATYSLNEDR